MPLVIYAGIFFISLFFGSFYNVVALRTLSGENLAFPASHCTTCNHNLGPFDLVPVLSWTFLGGKCRYCGAKISAIYPFGELLTAISYTLMVWKFGFSYETVIHIVFITVLIWATITDLEEMVVPDKFTLIGIVLVGALRILGPEPALNFFISGAVSFSILFAVLLLSGGKMGGADVKLYALIGLSVGLSASIASLFYASIIGVVIILPIMLKKGKSVKIPFVPFITLGVLGTYIINLYSFIAF